MIKKTIATVIAAAGIAVLGAAPAQAVPCKWPAGATWCAPRDGDDPFAPRNAGDHLVRPSAKTNVNDGKEPAIKFRKLGAPK